MSELLTHGNSEIINKCVLFFKKELKVLLVTLTEVKWPATMTVPGLGFLAQIQVHVQMLQFIR